MSVESNDCQIWESATGLSLAQDCPVIFATESGDVSSYRVCPQAPDKDCAFTVTQRTNIH